MTTNRTELDVMDHLRRFETRALLNSYDTVVLGTTFDIVTRPWGYSVVKKNLKLMRGYRYSVICAGITDLDDYRIHAKGKAIMYLSLTYSYCAQEGRLLWRGRPSLTFAERLIDKISQNGLLRPESILKIHHRLFRDIGYTISYYNPSPSPPSSHPADKEPPRYPQIISMNRISAVPAPQSEEVRQ